MGVRDNKLRYVLWTAVLGGFAVAVAAPWHATIASSVGGQGQGRKTTDPPVRAQGKLGQDLFLAIDHRDVSGVESLIKRGADPNSKNGLEFTPLAIAAASHQDDVMRALLGAGAQPDSASAYGTPLTFAAETANAEGAGLLLERGANVNTARGDGTTVLMMASMSGAPPLVGELLKRNADVKAKNESDATALTYAARGGHVEVGKMLLDAGAEIDSADVDGQTPLMAAAVTGHADFVKMLLEHGAKVNARDKKGQTALIMTAAYGDYPDVIHALLSGGADAKAADSRGRTAAAYAAARAFKQSASVLGSPTSSALAAIGKPRNPRDAVAVSLKALQSSMLEFSQNASCVSCHQEGLGRMTTGAARDRGFALNKALQQIQAGRISGALNAMQPMHEQALKDPEVMKQVPLIEINEVTSADTWLLAGMAAQKDPATKATAAMAMVMAKQQSPDGHWSFSLPRVPMQSSFFTFTALAVRSLQAYAPSSHAAETAGRIAKAKAWLLKTPAQTGDDRAFRLLGLKWAGADAAGRKKAVAEILAAQRPDGGWAQVPGLQSDAYATGQALYALRVGGGLSLGSGAYKRGVMFLTRTQDPDGSWFVNKRAFPANNYFDAGFPHGESQFSSFNGTCWATLALLETLG